MMDVIDYTRSFVHGTRPYNRVRFVVEARTRLIDARDGCVRDYVVCASCKSEDTYAKSQLFTDDNYDFLPVFGPDDGVVFRSKAYAHDGYRSVYPVGELFDGPRYRLCVPTSVRKLETNADIRQATHDGLPLVAQTEWTDENTGMTAIVECPVKTMNIHDENDWYQVDTGPVAYADLSQRPERLVDTLSLAFVAFNCTRFAEFILEAPTSITEAGLQVARVHHYSERVQVNGANRLFAVE